MGLYIHEREEKAILGLIENVRFGIKGETDYVRRRGKTGH